MFIVANLPLCRLLGLASKKYLKFKHIEHLLRLIN